VTDLNSSYAGVLSAEMDRVLIAVNPRAGRRSVQDRVEHLSQLLISQGLKVEVLTELAEVCARADEDFAARRLRALVGIGGDGTAAELLNRTQQGVPITLLPAGTANLLSKYFGLTGSPETLAGAIAAGTIVRLDVGRAGGRLFLLMLSCGFDAEVVHRVHAYRQSGRRGGHISYLTYFKPILESIRSYRYPEIQVYWDDPCGAVGLGESSITARWVFAFNLPCYGWGLPLSPAAVATDGLLDLCTFAQGSFWNGVRYLAAAQFGRHLALPDCSSRRVRRLRLEASEPVAYQLDGDPGGSLPLDVEVLPGRLTLLVPPSSPTLPVR